MLLMGHVLIPQSDLRWSKQADVGSTNLMFLMVVIQAHISISHTFSSWNDAQRSADSQPLPLSPALGGRVFGLGSRLVRVWSEYSMKRKEANAQNCHLTLEDCKQII